jgi:hypothetical protein
MLAFVKTLQLEGDASAPIKRSINPGILFFRAMVSAFRHGVRVRSG